VRSTGSSTARRRSEGGAHPGNIATALIDGESTLKRLVRDRKRAILRAENLRHRDLIPSESLVMQGVLVGVIGCGKR